MRSRLENKISDLSSWLVGLILVLAPFWAFFSVWISSGTGHYTAIRLVIECLLVLLFISCSSLLIIDKESGIKLVQQKWFWPLAAFVLLEIIWGLVAYLTNAVSAKALGYAWIADLRFLLFFVAVFLIANKSNWLASHWRQLIFIPAVVVAVFAILEFTVLPLNFMSHFGYNAHTIFPYETINHNKAFPRAMSFTRGANPLGAYLSVVVILQLAWLVKARRKLWLALLTLASLVALIFSFSRSAWLGLIVSLIFLVLLVITSARTRKLVLVTGTSVVIVFALLFVGFHNNPHLQNYLLHTQDHSASKISSNEGHVSAFQNGFNDLVSDPLGNGPGTAGPASVYNSDGQSRIYENYYLMIAGENGWLGLALLLAIFVLVARNLLKRQTKLATALFASFVGLAVANFFLPAWTDLTLAYVFWGMAGAALAVVQSGNGRKTNNRKDRKNSSADKKAARAT